MDCFSCGELIFGWSSLEDCWCFKDFWVNSVGVSVLKKPIRFALLFGLLNISLIFPSGSKKCYFWDFSKTDLHLRESCLFLLWKWIVDFDWKLWNISCFSFWVFLFLWTWRNSWDFSLIIVDPQRSLKNTSAFSVFYSSVFYILLKINFYFIFLSIFIF